ncbi:MAG: LEA type 2 family protein [Halofilum sp. (in: g-proteobacteria)]|nr:LEA type 2 family protein [Halofilum sp. (in: g-proteobacteria)]
MRTARLLLLVLSVTLLAGCATFRPEAPEVRLADLSIDSIGLFEQRYRLGLRMRNPNDRDLDVESLRFDLTLAGRSFAEGVNTEGFRLPANGEERVEVVVTSDLGSVLDLLSDWIDGNRALPYRLSGDARLAGWGGITVPFSRDGRLELPRGSN